MKITGMIAMRVRPNATFEKTRESVIKRGWLEAHWEVTIANLPCLACGPTQGYIAIRHSPRPPDSACWHSYPIST